MDIGLLLIRLAVGGTLAAHGSQKLFGAFGGHGLAGTAAFLESLGFRRGRFCAWLLGLTETAGGLMLAAGFLTPLAASGLTGAMLAAIVSAHRDKGFFANAGGFEFPLTLGVAALATAFTGPGRYSLDHAFGWHLEGAQWGVAAAILAVVASGLILASRHVRVPQRRKHRPVTA